MFETTNQIGSDWLVWLQVKINFWSRMELFGGFLSGAPKT